MTPDGSKDTLLTADPAKPAETPDPNAKPEDKSKEPAADPFDPEKLAMPEGFDKKDPLFQEFATQAKDLGLTQTQAQNLTGIYTKAIESVATANRDAWRQTVEGWRATVEGDTEIGGQKLTTTVLPAVAKLLDQYGGSEVRQALNLTGAGNHPALVKFFYKVATALGEGQHVAGGPSGSKPAGPSAQAMYPDLPPGA